MTVGMLPQLPLVCLKSADLKSTEEVVRGRPTVIDFWTTKCVRCPNALDKLDNMAQDPKYSDVQFVSICCDELDGARNIIEREEEMRWKHVDHYFMSKKDKEEAKKQLGFRSVPFYVVLDDEGEIHQMGNQRQIDFDDVPGVVPPMQEETKDDDSFPDPFLSAFSQVSITAVPSNPVAKDVASKGTVQTPVFTLDADF